MILRIWAISVENTAVFHSVFHSLGLLVCGGSVISQSRVAGNFSRIGSQKNLDLAFWSLQIHAFNSLLTMKPLCGAFLATGDRMKIKLKPTSKKTPDLANWNDCNIYKVCDQPQPIPITDIDCEKLSPEIISWLTALFQSEHLSLLLGRGISAAVHHLAKNEAESEMGQLSFSVFKEQIMNAGRKSALRANRGEPNIEDQIRVCNELIKGLRIYILGNVTEANETRNLLNKCEGELQEGMVKFANRILLSERNIVHSDNSVDAAECLISFLISFATRSATRERLNIFTTNYDRVVEYGSELAGIRLIDRFVGTINPVFRSSRVIVDMHYNPPGIRGEPRYLEGVVHFTKLHGSLDWSVKDGIVRRSALPYGAKDISTYLGQGHENLIIYPNPAKDKETTEYPYVELFRDFAASICRANSTVVVYGYSFGDSHINRVIADMLTIPSTHLVIISINDLGGRIKCFYESAKRPSQISLLIGDHFGNLKTLINNYLPKPAIDRKIMKMTDILKTRNTATNQFNHSEQEL